MTELRSQTAEAILRVASEHPDAVQALRRIPADGAFPAGPARALWQAAWKRACSGLSGPMGIAGVVEALKSRGVDGRTAERWWGEVLNRTQGVHAGSLEPLVGDLTAEHERDSLLEAASQAMLEVRAAAQQGAPASELRDRLLAAVESAHSAASVGVRTGEDANRLSLQRAQLAEQNGGVTGCTTGIDGLDRVLGYLGPGELTVVAARAKVGKTHAAIQIAGHVSGQPWKHLGDRPAGVLFVALEMSADRVFDRLIAWSAEVNYEVLMRRGAALRNEHVETARREVLDRPLWYLDAPGSSVSGIAAAARAVTSSHPVDLLVVDYLDLVRVSKTWGDRHDLALGTVVRELLLLGRNLNAHVILLVQINREGEKDATIKHLAHSDEIGRAAHNILILNTDGVGVFNVKEEGTKRALRIGITSRGPGSGEEVRVNLDVGMSRFTPGDMLLERLP